MASKLAIHGGRPIRSTLLPYGRQSISGAEVDSVRQVLESDWLTTGPAVQRLEQEFCRYVGVKEAVAVSSGTAALHASMHALGVTVGDEVIVPALTFAATANCVVYMGATPVFADIDPGTLLVDVSSIQSKLTPRTKAIIAVDYAGQACDYDAIYSVASPAGVKVVADACHALGGRYKSRNVGQLAGISTFSFHPVKHITSGEGGMTVTDDPEYARRMRVFRNHGITTEARARDQKGTWQYEMVELGFNYRLTDFQSVLAAEQLKKLPEFIARRHELAAFYAREFSTLPFVTLPETKSGVVHAYHLFVILLNLDRLRADRSEIFSALRAEGIGVNVHYIPVHMHPYYRRVFGTTDGMCPIAEATYSRLLTLPLFPAMTNDDAADVVEAVRKVLSAFER